ncbi:serine/threonine-protein kinase [Nonomuraea sp. NPDC051941]|uniref:serine/threonine-protein kinase n=1 Tax=Nonomuraea sp. NPDC051941 TaxID=3364373 RepID=UPI0037C5B8E1
MTEHLLAGRYRLARLLGAGGMGAVWQARDELLDREVAIKQLRPKEEVSADRLAELRERALREARVAARLRHPAIVTVHDVVEEDGLPWIVMDLVAGRTLEEVVRAEDRLPPKRVAAIGVRMLDALTHAHRRGILHRDVKPANVMIGPDGQALLTDFGIAAYAGDPGLTAPGDLVGSPGYMAPERLRGAEDGPPADLWSLGATLYAAAEGRPPFHRDTPMAVLGAVLTQPPAEPSFPGPLGPLLLALLAKDPAVRPDADRLRRDLGRIADGLPLAPEPPEPAEPPVFASGRHRRVAVVAGALVLAGTAVVAAMALRGQPVRTPSPSPSATRAPCDLLTLAQVAPLLPAPGKPTAVSGGCTWSADDDFLSLTVETFAPRQGRPGPEVAREIYAARRLAETSAAGGGVLEDPDPEDLPPRDVVGLGDEAFAVEGVNLNDAFSTLVFRVGDRLVKLYYSKKFPKGDKPAVTSAQQEGVLTMARLAAEATRTGGASPD